IELDSDGKNVLMPTLIAMFTAVRNNTLNKLSVNSLTDNGLLEITHKNANKNTKNRDVSLPLPPGLLDKLQRHIDLLGLEADDALLYGLRGRRLGNKQFNSITRTLCLALDW